MAGSSSPDIEIKNKETEEGKEVASEMDSETPDIHSTGSKIERAREVYREYTGYEEKPSKMELLAWYFYGLCSNFIQTALIPIVFSLITSQLGSSKQPAEPHQGWHRSNRGLPCWEKELRLYEEVTQKSVGIGQAKLSPLEFVSASWIIGLVIAAPIVSFLSVHLDHGRNHQLIAGAATLIGAISCFPAGFFHTRWIFPPYITAITVAHTIAVACHTRHLGLMIRGFTGPKIQKIQFQNRRGISAWLSLYGTASGGIGSALISAFTYYMLQGKGSIVNLWVVSIFSGIIWLAGILHVTIAPRFGASSPPASPGHALSISGYPHAIGSLVALFLSSFTTMCIFTGGVIFLVGQLCVKTNVLLFFWLIYFTFPSVVLPLMHPLQHVLRTNSVKMKILGFLLSLVTAGSGFYFRGDIWQKHHILLFAAIQSAATGILHAFGRVLVLDCSPPGKEGVFSVWYSWVSGLGMSAGFAMAAAVPSSLNKSFGVAFFAAVAGIVVLIYGNVSDLGGALVAGHVKEEFDEKLSPVRGLDTNSHTKEKDVESI